MTVGEFVQQWLDARAAQVHPNTLRSYRDRLKHVIETLGPKALARVTALDLQKLYGDMVEQGLSPRTVRYTHDIIKQALKNAVKWRLIPMNPAEDAEPPRVPRKELRVPTPDEASGS